MSSTHGRGILPDAHPRSLGAFHNSAKVEELLKASDLLVVVGSRLRSNETKTYSVQFPDNLIQIDANPVAQQRNYKVRRFICADAKDILVRTLTQLEGISKVDTEYDQMIVNAKDAAVAAFASNWINMP